MEISRQKYWSQLPFPSPGDLPNPGIEPGSPALPSEPPGKQGGFFTCNFAPGNSGDIKLIVLYVVFLCVIDRGKYAWSLLG